MMTSDITTVIFDVGDVLLFDTGKGLFEDAARAFGLGDDVARVERVAGELIPLYQKGSIDERTYWKIFAEGVGYVGQLPDDWRKLWRREFARNIRRNEPVFDLARALRSAVYVTPILSNTIPPHVEVMNERGLLTGFEPAVFSCSVGMRKPEREIYLRTLGLAEVEDPATAVFIDDQSKYVDAARAVGMRGIHYQSFEQLCDELRSLGLQF